MLWHDPGHPAVVEGEDLGIPAGQHAEYQQNNPNADQGLHDSEGWNTALPISICLSSFCP